MRCRSPLCCSAGWALPRRKTCVKRPYVLVGAFVVGMLLTPPDVFSQTLLAIPMYCLFEVGVFFARFYTGKRLTRDDDAAAEAEAAEHREE